MRKTASIFKTVPDLTAESKFSLAVAQIDSKEMLRDITRCLDGLRRVPSSQSEALVAHFQGILNRADKVQGRAYFDYELKRVALGLSLVSVGDL